MPDCCTGTPLDIGCYESCDTVQIFSAGATGTPVTTTQTGTHTVKLTNGREIATFTLTSGDPIAFSNPFNEDACSVFQIILPDSTPLTVGATNCFTIEVNPPNSPTLASVTITCPDVTIINGCTLATITTVSAGGSYTVPCITDLDGGTASSVPSEYGVIDGGSS